MTRLRAKGTHQGELMGHQPTGRKITVEEVDIFRIEDGKITEIWVSVDQLDLLKQLGFVPSPSEQ